MKDATQSKELAAKEARELAINEKIDAMSIEERVALVDAARDTVIELGDITTTTRGDRDRLVACRVPLRSALEPLGGVDLD